MEIIKLYLDMCSYNRPFDIQTQMKIRLETEAKLHIQTNVREGIYTLCWSYILDYENEKNPYRVRRNMITPWKNFAVDYCPPSDSILSRGKKIMTLGVKQMDALHIACAIECKCDYLITTDNKLINKTIMDIKVINPIDFIREMEDLL